MGKANKPITSDVNAVSAVLNRMETGLVISKHILIFENELYNLYIAT